MKHFIFFIVSFILFISWGFPLYGEEKEVTLEEVVVTATRDAQEIRKVPANVSVITKEEIEKSDSKSVVDLVRDEEGVIVRDYFGTGKAAMVDLRGFGETGALNTLVLVDGRRVNEIDLSGVDWSQIPLNQVERIEIVRGPGSVLYGDNAVGGVINIITKRPEKPFSASEEVVIGSYHYNKESGSVSGKWGPLSAILNASYNATGGYRDNGFFRTKDVGGKLIYDLNDAVSFNLSGNFHRDDTGLPYGLPKNIYELNRRASIHPDDKAETDDGYATLGIKAKLLDFGRIEADFSYRHRDVSDFYVSSQFEDKRNSSTWGVTPKYIFEKPLWNFPNKLTFGLDFYKSNSVVFSDSDFLGPNRSEVTKRSTGVYVFDELSFFNNLILSLGYRQELVNFDIFQDVPKSKDTARHNEPAWNVGLNYLFGKNSSAFFSFKRSFRFPVTDELIQYILSPDTFEVIDIQANPAMKPQTGYHYEAGIRHAFTDQIEANLTLFWIDLHNEIFYNPFTFSNENYPRTRRQGIEVRAKGKPFPWLLVWGNYSYIRPILRGGSFSGNDMPGVPRHKGSIGTEVDFGRGFQLSTKANIVGSRYFFGDWNNEVERLAGYYTVDAKLCYAWKGLKTFVGVNNLFNRKYAEFAAISSSLTEYFYASPERNFIGGISYTF
jgi:iron complex outermembrane receptor protein